MNSIDASDTLLKVNHLRMFFELEHYENHSVRDVFISALTNPVEYFFRKKELLYVIDGVSFEVKRGMRLGIIGVNGSGKTSLCRCLAGMMVAQEGFIEASGEVRAIFDTGTGVMPELTGRENAYLLARLFFPTIEDLSPLVNEALEFSELGHFIDIPFRQYSRGMQARLLLSLISSISTDVLILDEVFDGADVFFQHKLARRMKGFIEKAGATIFVSHSAEQIRDVCNQVLVLEKGKVTFIGEVEEGLAHYLKSNPSIAARD
jgi:ABC-type polysaccharide/polyol phosphate transport system ATPase subunit